MAGLKNGYLITETTNGGNLPTPDANQAMLFIDNNNNIYVKNGTSTKILSGGSGSSTDLTGIVSQITDLSGNNISQASQIAALSGNSISIASQISALSASSGGSLTLVQVSNASANAQIQTTNNLSTLIFAMSGNNISQSTQIAALSSSYSIISSQGLSGYVLKSQLTRNIKSFGVSGDGVTDDTSGMQNAMNWLSSVYGRGIELVNGETYLVSSLTLDKADMAVVNGNNAKIAFTKTTSGAAWLIQDSSECVIDRVRMTTASDLVDVIEMRNNGLSVRRSGGMLLNTVKNCQINFGNGWPGCRRGIYISDSRLYRDNNSEHTFIGNTICQFKQSAICFNSRNSLQNTIAFSFFYNEFNASYSTNAVAIETMSETVSGYEQGGGGFAISRCVFMPSGGLTHSFLDNTAWLFKLQGEFLHELVISDCVVEDSCGFMYLRVGNTDTNAVVTVKVNGVSHKGGRQPASGYLNSIDIATSGSLVNAMFKDVSTHQGRTGVRIEVGSSCALHYHGGVLAAGQVGGSGRFSGMAFSQIYGSMTYDNGFRIALREIYMGSRKFIHGIHDTGYVNWIDHYEGDGSTYSYPLTNSRAPSAHASTHAFGGNDAITVSESQVTNLITDLAAKSNSITPVFTNTITVSGVAPIVYFHESDGTYDVRAAFDGGSVAWQKCSSSNLGIGAYQYTFANFSSDGTSRWGRVSGGTYNGNTEINASDNYPSIIFYSGGSNKKGALSSDANLGILSYDCDAGSYHSLRDTYGGVGGEIARFKLTNSYITSPLKVTSISAAATPSSTEVSFGGGNIKIGRTTDALTDEVVRGNDSRLSTVYLISGTNLSQATQIADLSGNSISQATQIAALSASTGSSLTLAQVANASANAQAQTTNNLSALIFAMSGNDISQSAQIAQLSGANISQATQIVSLSASSIVLAQVANASANAQTQTTNNLSTLIFASSGTDISQAIQIAQLSGNSISVGSQIVTLSSADMNQATQISQLSGANISQATQISQLSGNSVTLTIVSNASANAQIQTTNNLTALIFPMSGNDISQSAQISQLSGNSISVGSQVVTLSSADMNQATQISQLSGANISQATQIAALSANSISLSQVANASANAFAQSTTVSFASSANAQAQTTNNLSALIFAMSGNDISQSAQIAALSANNVNVVHISGNENIYGSKDFVNLQDFDVTRYLPASNNTGTRFRVLNNLAGFYDASSARLGSLVITLPISGLNAFFGIKFKLWEYNNGRGIVNVEANAYEFNGSYAVASATSDNVTRIRFVKFAVNTTNGRDCLILSQINAAPSANTWSYPQGYIESAMIGYDGGSTQEWNSPGNYTVSFATDESIYSIKKTIDLQGISNDPNYNNSGINALMLNGMSGANYTKQTETNNQATQITTLSGNSISVASQITALSGNSATKTYVQSRVQNLITNGSGLMGNNYNFSGFVFDQSDVFAGFGAFTNNSGSTTKFIDELVPVDVSRKYRFSYYIKVLSQTNVETIRHYGFVTCYDSDSLSIAPYHILKYNGSTYTTLAANLSSGATTMTLTNAAGWYNGGTAHQRTIGFWPYTNSKGYTYPDYTYTRNIIYDGVNGAWPVAGITGNVIGLTTPYVGATLPAGTRVANMLSGGSFDYIAGANTPTPSAWAKYEGTLGPDSGVAMYTPPAIGSTVSAGGDLYAAPGGFRWGTALVNVGWLLSYQSVGTSKNSLSVVSFELDNATPSQVANASGNALAQATTLITLNSAVDANQAVQIAALSGNSISVATQIASLSGTTISQATQIANISSNYSTITSVNAGLANRTKTAGDLTDYNSVQSRDIRSTNTPTSAYNPGLYVDFKANSTDSLNDSNTYHGVLTFRPYGSGIDFSGGVAHQLGFTDTGNIYNRIGSAAQWNSWNRIVRDIDLAPITGTNFSQATQIAALSGNSISVASQIASLSASIGSGSVTLSMVSNASANAQIQTTNNLTALIFTMSGNDISQAAQIAAISANSGTSTSSIVLSGFQYERGNKLLAFNDFTSVSQINAFTAGQAVLNIFGGNTREPGISNNDVISMPGIYSTLVRASTSGDCYGTLCQGPLIGSFSVTGRNTLYGGPVLENGKCDSKLQTRVMFIPTNNLNSSEWCWHFGWIQNPYNVSLGGYPQFMNTFGTFNKQFMEVFYRPVSNANLQIVTSDFNGNQTITPSTFTPVKNVWYNIELRTYKVNANYDLYINDVYVMTVSSGNLPQRYPTYSDFNFIPYAKQEIQSNASNAYYVIYDWVGCELSGYGGNRPIPNFVSN